MNDATADYTIEARRMTAAALELADKAEQSRSRVELNAARSALADATAMWQRTALTGNPPPDAGESKHRVANRARELLRVRPSKT